MNTYTLGPGVSITCHWCGMTSHSAEDVLNLYCGHCHRWHAHGLRIFTIYFNPSDHPGMFVLRGCTTDEEGEVIHDRCCLLGRTLEDVRSQVPAGLVMMERNPDDDPVIVEVWI